MMHLAEHCIPLTTLIFKRIHYMIQLIGNAEHLGFLSDYIPGMTRS
jgi:hypothetical protein